MRCRLIWKMKGTKYSRLYFQSGCRCPGYSGTEFGLYPTPRASEGERGSERMVNHGERKAGKQKSERFEVRVESKDSWQNKGLIPTPGVGITRTNSQKHFESKERPPLRSVTELHKIQSWYSWPLQSPVCDGDYGLSSRLDGITFPLNSEKNQSKPEETR